MIKSVFHRGWFFILSFITIFSVYFIIILIHSWFYFLCFFGSSIRNSSFSDSWLIATTVALKLELRTNKQFNLLGFDGHTLKEIRWSKNGKIHSQCITWFTIGAIVKAVAWYIIVFTAKIGCLNIFNWLVVNLTIYNNINIRTYNTSDHFQPLSQLSNSFLWRKNVYNQVSW